MKKLFTVTIRGYEKLWSFEFEADDIYWQDWLDDGLEVDEVVGVIGYEP